MPNEEKKPASNEISNVSKRVLNTFIEKLASDEEYSEVAERLKSIVLSDKVSEKSLQIALFGEENS
ncbi:TPA: hypothetical protein ACPYPV_000956 [Legionella pneumophila]|nr:hypothetical protein [Legionella pneumophila subsp. pneumophila]HAU0786428.1 hypothetical protein [Legionella pneumophila]HAU0811861.1 hypothetical protein [Legionella pneumophila]HAU0906863.1 hypothetical protein [Legionella pneumophila]HAU0937551.1 hypothetical protein [Legionella pneumophila]